jgi:hypothetical protein
MFKITQVIGSLFFALLLYSCKGQIKTRDACEKKFKLARDLAYANSTRQSALDSAMVLVNECMQCDSIRKAVVDFKITLLVSMKKYAEGIHFIDSLQEKAFTYGYKQKFMSKGLRALEFNAKNDTIKRNMAYREMASDMEEYIEKRDIGSEEFEEIYLDLFGVKEKYLDANQINKEVEALKNKYPNKQSFFNFLKK